MTENQFASGTMLAEMLIDIYASKKRDDVWIWHDKVFEPKLTSLEFNEGTKALVFIFEDDSRKDLGAQLRDALLPLLAKVDEISFAQMDMETKQPVDMFTVPLSKV